MLAWGGPRRSFADFGSAVGAAFAAQPAFQLADHAVDELHAVVDTAGAELQELLRQGFTELGWACVLWLFHFAVVKFTWVWPSPFAQAARGELDSYAARVHNKCAQGRANSLGRIQQGTALPSSAQAWDRSEDPTRLAKASVAMLGAWAACLP